MYMYPLTSETWQPLHRAYVKRHACHAESRSRPSPADLYVLRIATHPELQFLVIVRTAKGRHGLRGAHRLIAAIDYRLIQIAVLEASLMLATLENCRS